jgi:hypothetical protein
MRLFILVCVWGALAIGSGRNRESALLTHFAWLSPAPWLDDWMDGWMLLSMHPLLDDIECDATLLASAFPEVVTAGTM